jgi:hypothetical protein
MIHPRSWHDVRRNLDYPIQYLSCTIDMREIY